MENGKHLVYEFGGFQLDIARQKLLRQGQPVALAPKLFETLVFLVENRDRTLLKGELMRALWTGTFVEESNLSQNIFLLRKALGDDRNGHSFIHTVPRRGYRFVAPVTEIGTESMGPLPGARDWEYWKKHSPFRSLSVFEPEDAWLFFGREGETEALVRRLRRSPVVAVVGNSGSGKSSLLRAGLIPALCKGRSADTNGSGVTVAGELWRIVLMRPSAAPFDYLAEVLVGQLAPELTLWEQAEFIADFREKLTEGGDALRNAIGALVSAAASKTGTGSRARVLLVVDQFEELFTLTGKQAVRDGYIDILMAAAGWDGAVPVHLVFALRADFYGHCLDHPGLSRCLESSLLNLGGLTAEQMRETIEKRLALAGGRGEPGLIDSLLEDVGAEPGNLALLEHALGQLWEQCGGPGCTFTNLAYTRMGRLRGALGRHADEIIENLDEEYKALAQKIFLELVHLGEGAQDTRRRVAKAELLTLGEPQKVEQLLARLASSRLIATGREGEETFVEVSHEALIREWPALRQWIEENRQDLSLERRLEQTAEEWQSLGRDPEALLQGARLAQAEDWLVRRPDSNASARDYVQAGIVARAELERKAREAQQRELDQEKTTARRFRWFSYALGVLLLLAATSAWFAVHQRVLETSRAMAAEAVELAPRDRGQALDLALRGFQKAKTEEAGRAVAKIFADSLLVLHHDGEVPNVSFSSDGERIVTSSDDHTARLWSARDGRLLATLRHNANVTDAEFSPNGLRIVTASDDHTARIWDGTNGRMLAVLQGHSAKVSQASFSPDGRRVLTASADQTARVWDANDGRLLLALKGHSRAVLEAIFSPDARRILTVSDDKTARLWDSASGQSLSILQGHSDSVFAADFSRDGRRIATASNDGTARLWNAADARLIAVLHHDAPVLNVTFSPDGRRVATAGFDYTARIWDSRDGSPLLTVRHDLPVSSVAFSPDGRYLATGSYDRTARIWSATTGRLLSLLQGHSAFVYGVAFSPAGDQIATGSADHTVKIWNLRAARASILFIDNSPLQNPSFSPDGKLVCARKNDDTVHVRTVADGRERFQLKGVTGQVLVGSFSPDSKRIVTAGVDSVVQVWSARDGSLLHSLRGHSASVNSASFSPDGQRILTAGSDHTARLWSADDGQLLATLQGHSSEILDAEFSPDGRRIVTASNDHTLRLWDGRNAAPLATLLGHTATVYSAMFSPDGQLIVSASEDHTLRLWTSDGRPVKTLDGETAERGAIFSPDSQRIASIGGTGGHAARLWDRQGHLLAVLNHADQVIGASFSPDSQFVVTYGLDATARVWNSRDGRLVVTLPGHLLVVHEARFLSDDRHLFTAGLDPTVRIWEILTLDDIERILSK